VDPEQFRAHVHFLASGRLRVVPLDQIATVPESVDAVAVTFDDGFANFATTAVPLLREHALPATVFVVAGRAGSTNLWDRGSGDVIPELALMDWDALGEVAGDGIEVGAHSMTHADLTVVSDDEREAEIAGSGDVIARQLGAAPRAFAYPYGKANGVAIAAARSAYERACGTELRLMSSTDDPFLLPRLDAYYFRERGRLESWGTLSFRRWLWLRAQGRRVRGMAARVGVGR
jgi:peptidoglycan/xylan/chitin deacetylase (PgdA/CDA1 family)